MILNLPNFSLESGVELTNVDISYQSWGKLNPEGNNAILVCHGLTGNEDVADWWGDLFGDNNVFDENKHFIVASNCLGSCYGTVGPTSINPLTEKCYGADFPRFTIRDAVALQATLLKSLGVTQLEMVIGPSMGGMQTLEWTLNDFPVKSAVVIGCGASHSSWAIGISHTQRQAIFQDPKWKGGNYGDNPPRAGLSIARQIAMLAYRSHPSFVERFKRDPQDGEDDFDVESYLSYQGNKLVDRFDANSYVRLTQMMDSHDVGRERGGVEAALSRIDIPILILGISSDVLYPLEEQLYLAENISQARLEIVDARQGHDAFLIELNQLNERIVNWRQSLRSPIVNTIPS